MGLRVAKGSASAPQLRWSVRKCQSARALPVTPIVREDEVSDTAPSFDNDIKPLFRDRDRGAMLTAFDLWSYDDVRTNADRILQAVSSGSMPCDTQWPDDRVDLLRRWIERGTPS